MKQFIKAYWKTLLFFAVTGLLGGFFTGIYVLDSYPPEMRQKLLHELTAGGLGGFRPDMILGVITAMQAAGYGIVLGAAGIWLGRKTGLWKEERTITKRPFVASVVVSIVGGAVLTNDYADRIGADKYARDAMEAVRYAEEIIG